MQLDSAIKGDQNHPNALLLARITYHGSYEIIWQINNPDIVHEYLQNIINETSYPREMDYRIEYDEKWKNVKWYLQDFQRKRSDNQCLTQFSLRHLRTMLTNRCIRD